MDRTAGEGRYAHMEREQRWLLHALPEGVEQPVSIIDLYVRGTRLRVRRMETAEGVVYKLGQKVRPAPEKPDVVKLTNMYLSEREYIILAALGADEIVKTRWRWASGDGRLVVDEFQGALTGLVLAEIELGPDGPRQGDPPGAVTDVTDDDRFSGGTLAATTDSEIRRLLESLGVVR